MSRSGKNGRHFNGLPALIEDLLESNYGVWYTKSTLRALAPLRALAVDQRPHITAETFEKAYMRVKVAPRIPIERRHIDGWQPEVRCPERMYLTA